MKCTKENCFNCRIRHDCEYFVLLIENDRLKMYPCKKGSVSERKHQAEMYYDGYDRCAYN